MQTIENAIISALVENPGEHSVNNIYKLVRQVLPRLSFNTLMVRITYLTEEGKIKRSGMRHHYRYKI